MEKINLNDLDVKVAYAEGKKIQLPIGQIKETRACVFRELGKFRGDQILEAVYRITDRESKKGGGKA